MPAAYTAYTPTWTASTTNPVIGNGSLSGRYVQVGKLVHCWGIITAGSTTTFGTGSYRFAIPVAANASLSSPVGQIHFRDSGVGDYILAIAQIVTSTTCQITQQTSFGANTVWTPTAPFTFGSGDSMRFNLVYEAA